MEWLFFTSPSCCQLSFAATTAATTIAQQLPQQFPPLPLSQLPLLPASQLTSTHRSHSCRRGTNVLYLCDYYAEYLE
jgi:hypothetical protein